MSLGLERVLLALQSIAPLELAEEWDNAGLLLEPVKPRKIRKISLTIDLTEPVLAEALAGRADLVVAYHPPWFHPLRRLSRSVPHERVLLRAIRAGLSIYSPHTALDAAPGGVNDWLADGLGAGLRRSLVRPPRTTETAALAIDAEREAPVAGQGRELILARPVSLNTLLNRIKRHLSLSRLRVARAERHRSGHPSPALIERIALCAGAGAEVLAGSDAELLLTGEMRHHDVLARVAASQSVVLSEHSHTERGYLPVLERRLRDELGPEVKVAISARDADPLVTA